MTTQRYYPQAKAPLAPGAPRPNSRAAQSVLLKAKLALSAETIPEDQLPPKMSSLEIERRLTLIAQGGQGATAKESLDALKTLLSVKGVDTSDEEQRTLAHMASKRGKAPPIEGDGAHKTRQKGEE